MRSLQNIAEGVAGKISAPASPFERAVELDFDKIGNAPPSVSTISPSPDPKALAVHASAGHELIPLKHWKAKGKDGMPAGKEPVGSWRREQPLPLVEARRRMLAGANVGVRLRACDLVLDVDPRNFEPDDDPLARLKADFSLPDAPFVKTSGGGLHLYFRKPVDLTIAPSLAGYPGVDFASLGRYVVAAGSVHPQGLPYLLDDDPLALSLAEAPEAPQALLDAIAKHCSLPSRDSSGEITTDQLEQLLSKLDIMKYNHRYDDWLEIMMSSHYATRGAGLEEFLTWSISDADYTDHDARIRSQWRGLKIKPDGVKLGTLLKALSDAGHRAWIEQVLRSSATDDFTDPPEIAQSKADLALIRMNQSHLTVLHGGKYLVGRETCHPTLGHTVIEWFPEHAIRSHLDSKTVEVEDGKHQPLGSWWVKHPRRRQYEGVVFDPAPNRTHACLYNLWRGWAVEPKPGDWSLMKRLLRDVLCRGHQGSFEYVLRWSAFMVQRPHVPAEVALVFKGTKGVGKGTFGRALKLLAGMHGKQVAQAEHFVGRFNEHLMDCIMLFVDEGYWAGDPKAAGALKNLITEPVLSFEPKGRPIVSGPNMLHVVIASNEDWIVPASVDERRFAVFEADSDARKRLPSGFFEDLNAQMQSGGLPAMLHELLSVDLHDWHPRSAIPNTQALVDQKVQAFRREPLAFWWFRTLEAGACDPMLNEAPWTEASFDIDSAGKEHMLVEIGSIAKGMGRPAQFSKKAVAQFLKSVGVDVNAKDSRGARIWRVPALAEARAAFEHHVGGALDWDGT